MKVYYEDNAVVLYLGDCRDVLPGLEDTDEAAIITDPPYGIAFVKGLSGKAGAYHGGAAAAAASRSNSPIIGDAKPFDPQHLLSFDNVLLWGANHYCQRLPEDTGRWLAWNKLDGLESFDSFSDVEFAWHSRGKVSRIFNYMWKNGLACKKAGENNGRRLYPTQKPIALMRWSIQQAGNPAVVIDPYCGSGTTGVAAKQLGRKAILIDISEEACEIAAQRLMNCNPLPFPEPASDPEIEQQHLFGIPTP